MSVDNRLETAKLKIYYMLMLGLIFSLSAYYYYEYQAGYGYLIADGIIALAYLFMLLRKSDYFFLEYKGNKIVVRYYTAHPFLRKYRAFEIPQPYFAGYEIIKSLGGIRKMIQFKIETPKGKFKYPPVSISLLTKKQEAELLNILKELTK
jgi:hypothetical protein